ncbi:hypothetical protein SOVF_089550 [Spinacia oleracea]|nr:hypothetical protein SOVF_089550 [Spinacia oleracea]
MARKWQKMAASSRRKISWPRPLADKGHFVVYTTDGRRFMIPLTCLKNEIFTELFRMAEEEFGIASSGPIMLPCDSSFMEYAISMIQRHAAQGLEKALITSLASSRYTSLSNEHQAQTKQQLLISSF